MADATTLGPVQLMVVAFDEPNLHGQILAELDKLRDHGLVRVIDAILVQKDDAGNVTTQQLSDLTLDEVEEIGTMAAALIGLGAAGEEGAIAAAEAVQDDLADGHILDGAELIDVVGEIPPGSAAAVALLEHRWAIGLREAIVDAGGLPVVDMWIHPLDLVAIGLAAAEGG